MSSVAQFESIRSAFVPPRGSRLHAAPSPDLDVERLAAALRHAVRGEVRFDDGSRALYATDASNYRQIPIGAVIPRDVDDVVATVAECRRFGAPVVSRGGGTSLAGQCCNVAVVLDFSKYLHWVLHVDPDQKTARVQPGCVLDDLRDAAERHHLTFGPDPATHNHCTLGGMIGNNSCGVHAVMAGRTVDNVRELEVLTYDGLRMRVGPTPDREFQAIVRAGGRRAEIYRRLKVLITRVGGLVRERYPHIPRRVSGYNLDELLPENGFNVARALVGTEGTCAVVLEAVLRLIDSPPCRNLLVLGYPDVYAAGEHASEVMAHGPIGCEGIDDGLVNDMQAKGMHPGAAHFLPDGKGWLLVEFGGDTLDEADGKARVLMDALRRSTNPPAMKLYDDPKEVQLVWEIRESGLGATAFVPGARATWPGWEDAAVPPEREGEYLRRFRALLDRYGYRADLYGHFGQGCIHTRIDFDLTSAPGIRRYRAFIADAADLVVSLGGSLSGEHGDGQSRAELLPKMFGRELVDAFAEFKAIWDPADKMNPHKVVHPYRATDNLRLGSGYNAPEPRTHFHYEDDEGSFAHATLRCVGVGKCRRAAGGTMCPSYMVTREEMHSTRGRARLLFEMLQGQAIRGGWRDEHVKEALDLCLACKGCKGDCPVNVDMATYKAEFLSHYYARRLRPMSAYSMGLIHRWARLASPIPWLANAVAHAPVIGDLFKYVGGIAPQRDIPRFAPQSFQRWFRGRPRHNGGRPQVMLWPDTFNNYFFPRTARAAVEVLEAAGFEVLVSPQALCCGRPLYDYGMLDTARALLERTLHTLRPQIEAGIPVVALEPSCAAVFRDELVNLIPYDQDARRLKEQTMLLSEFLQRHAPDFQPPRLACTAVVHGHCHHKAVMKFTSEQSMLAKLGLDFQVLDSGCCGMAGSFGFERQHYAMSMQVGERVVLPAVRAAPKNALIIADGFSCREQIRSATDRRALHLAEVMQLALHDGVHGAYPERRFAVSSERRAPSATRSTLAVIAAGALLLGGVALATRALAQPRLRLF